MVGITRVEGGIRGTRLGAFASEMSDESRWATEDVLSAVGVCTTGDIHIEPRPTITGRGQSVSGKVTNSAASAETSGGGSTEAAPASTATSCWTIADLPRED